MKWRTATAVAFVLIAFIAIPAFSHPAAAGGLVPIQTAKEELLGAPLFPGPSEQDAQNALSGSSQLVVGPNVRVNAPQSLFPNGLLTRSETTITIAGDGQLLVAGFNDADGFLRRPFTRPGQAGFQAGRPPGLSGFGFSTDGGTTWTDGDVPFIAGAVDPNFASCGGLVTRGDPWLGSSDPTARDATIFYANLAVHEFDGDPAFPQCAFGGSTAGISVHLGGFFETSSGTFSFAWNDVRLLQAIPGVGKSVGFPLDFYDKEALDAKKGVVAASVSNFVGRAPNIIGCGFGQIELWTSADAGDTFQGPILVQIDQVSDASCATGRLNQGSQPIIVDGDTVVVVWQNGPDFVNGAPQFPLDVKILASTCHIEERSCSAPVVVDSINSMRVSPPQGYNRNRQNDFPRIALSEGGKIFVVYATGTGTPTCFVQAPGCVPVVFPESNILLKFSSDGGRTFEGPAAVNPPNDGRKDFWPVVSVDDKGNVNVAWVSSQEVNLTPDPTDIECIPGFKQGGGGPAQDGTRSSLVDVVLAQSQDGGRTFGPPVRVTDVTSNWCKARTNVRPTFGDYIDAKSLGESIFIVWGDGRCGATQTVCPPAGAGAPDTLAPPAGPRDRESDVFYSMVREA